jgi:sugar phosphate isomerase/epimerase
MRPAIKVGLSTASVYPLRAEAAFAYAAELGYDGIELMVWAEPLSQNVVAVAELSRRYRVPVLSVDAPCLLILQRVWGSDPVAKLEMSVVAAERLGAATVVVQHGGEHVPLPRRPVLRFRDSVDRADAATRRATGSGGLGVRPVLRPT